MTNWGEWGAQIDLFHPVFFIDIHRSIGQEDNKTVLVIKLV